MRSEALPARAGAPMTEHSRVTVRHLVVRDFRNIAIAELPLPSDGIALVGENGQGKTNLLEAVSYLALFRSVRGVRDRDLLRHDTATFHLSATTTHAMASRVSIGVSRAGEKRVSLDDVEAPRLADALGAVPSVCFSPADVSLVTGSPGERRRFLDIVLALSGRRYLTALRMYRAALARRNAALRQAAHSRSDGAVAAWEPALAEHGALLLAERAAWVQRVAPEFARCCAEIGEQSPVAISYQSVLAGAVPPAAYREALAAALARGRAHDIRRGVTQSGPHRDDVALTLGGRELRIVGSAGQQRTAAIALRLLEAATLRESSGAQPILLLDDPFAELDRARAARVLALLDERCARDEGQTLLCVPREDDIPAAFTRLERWRVTAGAFVRA